MHSLAGLLGIDPSRLTLRELVWQAQGKRAAIVAQGIFGFAELSPATIEEFIESGTISDHAADEVLPYSPGVMEALHNGICKGS